MKDWDFIVDGELITTRVNSNLQVNDADGYLSCGLQGHGLIRPPSYVARPYLDSGRLREVLAPFKGPPVLLHIVYAHDRLVSTVARVFADWLCPVLANSPLLA